MKSFKIFFEAETPEIIQPLPDKAFYNKSFYVLRQYSSLSPRNGAVQIFFLTRTRNMFAGKFLK